jgi:hypothetical protein
MRAPGSDRVSDASAGPGPAPRGEARGGAARVGGSDGVAAIVIGYLAAVGATIGIALAVLG